MSREESICCNDLWASVGRGTCLGPVSVNAMQQPSCPRSGTAQDVFPMAPRHPAGVSASQKSRLEGCWRGHYSFCHLRARSMSPQGSLSSELPNAGAELPTALVFSNRQATFIRNSLIRDSLHLKGLRKEGVFHSRQQNYCSQCWCLRPLWTLTTTTDRFSAGKKPQHYLSFVHLLLPKLLESKKILLW